MENFFYSMFDYKNFPKSMPKEYAERYLIWYGEVAAGKVPEKYNKGIYKGEAVFLHSNTAGGDDGVGLDIYGLGNQVIVTGCNGFNDVAGFDKYAVGFNNSSTVKYSDESATYYGTTAGSVAVTVADFNVKLNNKYYSSIMQ